MGIVKKIRRWYDHRGALRRLRELSTVFGTIARLEEHSLLTWNEKERKLFIAQPLAQIMMATGASGWANFLSNVYFYTFYNRAQDAWNSRALKREAAAVRVARRENPIMTKAEAMSVRMAARADMSEDEVTMEDVKPLEFYILAPSDGKDGVRVISVGDFNPDRGFEMADWDEVSRTMQELKNKKERK